MIEDEQSGVEWIRDEELGALWCPFCFSQKGDGHTPLCVIVESDHPEATEEDKAAWLAANEGRVLYRGEGPKTPADGE